MNDTCDTCDACDSESVTLRLHSVPQVLISASGVWRPASAPNLVNSRGQWEQVSERERLSGHYGRVNAANIRLAADNAALQAQLVDAIANAKGREGGAVLHSEIARERQIAQELRVQREWEARSTLNRSEAAAAKALQLVERERDATLRKLDLQQRQLDTSIPRAAHARALSAADARTAAIQRKLNTVTAAYTVLQQAETDRARRDTEAAEEAAESEAESDGSDESMGEEVEGEEGGVAGKEEGREVRRLRVLVEKLKKEIGLQDYRSSLPTRLYEGSGNNAEWAKLSRRHLFHVLKGRGGDDSGIENIADALHRAGYIDKLMETKAFRALRRAIARETVAKVSEHWTARLSVHLWDRLDLSREDMEVLRHLLSFVYDPATNKYLPVRVWENPDDPSDFVASAKLPGRHRRETLYRDLVDACDIVVGPNGRCERDCEVLVNKLYSDYRSAMRSNFSPERPAQPILTLDGTGAALGRGICHESVGTADFTHGVKQSRATLKPAGLYSGNDHAMPLRENASYVAKTFNRVIKAGCITREDGSMIPARPISVADMQGAKCLAGMRECCHSVWCKCQSREGGPQFEFPDGPMATYEEMAEYIDGIGDGAGCEIKTEEELCGFAHYSPGVARGGKFTRFTCGCCGYSPTKTQWEKDLAAFEAQTDEQQAAARAEHNEMGGAADKGMMKHFHQILYMPPMLHIGMDRAGVDQLHLIYLNLFKHLFKFTLHQPLPGGPSPCSPLPLPCAPVLPPASYVALAESKKMIVRDYFKAANFYSYDAADEAEDPVKRWIGREVKRFLEEAHIHLPFLLQLAAAPADVCEEMAACENEEGEQTMEYDEEYGPDEEELAREEAEEPLMCANAQAWDDFLNLVRAIQAPWAEGDDDTDEYRKLRALETFNVTALVCNDLKRLSPTMRTWVPHIALFIVPRQMVELGDPARRAADACESFGAMVKKIIKHLTCRRTAVEGSTAHHVGGVERWRQTFRRGFIQQAFERVCVRAELRLGEGNAPYLQRADVLGLQATGRAGSGRASGNKPVHFGPRQSVRNKVTALLQVPEPEDV